MEKELELSSAEMLDCRLTTGPSTGGTLSAICSWTLTEPGDQNNGSHPHAIP